MGRQRSWTIKQLEKAAAESSSIRQLILKLGLVPAGGNYVQTQQYLDEHKIDTSHFKGRAWNRGLTGIGKPIIPLVEILVENSNYQSFKLKQRLFRVGLKKPECEECGWAKIAEGGYLPLELDHINGRRHDNRIENLRVLCPNCHSLKPTHRGRMGRGKKKSRGGEIGRHATFKTS